MRMFVVVCTAQFPKREKFCFPLISLCPTHNDSEFQGSMHRTMYRNKIYRLRRNSCAVCYFFNSSVVTKPINLKLTDSIG